MVISTCGFGSTGSSAICDYLMECENVINFDAIEFTLCTAVDGLEDLEFHLMKQPNRQDSSVYAIQRFRRMIKNNYRYWYKNTPISKAEIESVTEEFLNSIIQVKYVGYSPKIDKNTNKFFDHYIGNSFILHRLIPYMERKGWIKNNIDFYPLDKVEMAVLPTNFYSAAKQFLKKLLTLMGCDFSKKIVLDQAFVGNNPQKSFPFFEDAYAIVVDRDPRDLYIFAKEKLLSRGRFMPSDTVENFAQYYRIMRDGQPYKNVSDRVLCLNFEDMVYNYDDTTIKIDNFLEVKNNNRRSIFVPEISAANTNLITRFPRYKDEVAMIESLLPEYLFPFEKYTGRLKNVSKEMFFGKSPLNKK